MQLPFRRLISSFMFTLFQLSIAFLLQLHHNSMEKIQNEYFTSTKLIATFITQYGFQMHVKHVDCIIPFIIRYMCYTEWRNCTLL